ncbi:iron complex outermembrane receptor protein [Luteibacter sp. Sphag1AF]|uniref:TonB-dependent receptor n=1 Tax=Luteibacter sp. Sphag1AF TaxID=2587031 RepID=UPI001618C70A|nr:TonB-dependent receptor [Luteibacter sp. Sphag1AF]MBB3227635.1 iron complex outermembrane receptor protein [Luteibacter sp. Sphag1AF]
MNRNSLSAAIALTLFVAAGAASAQDTQATQDATTQPQRANVASTSNTTNDNATRRAAQQMSAVQVKANSLALGGGLMSVQDAAKAVSTVSRDAIVKAAPGATFVQAIDSIPGVVSSTDDYTGLNDGNATVRGFPMDEIGVTVNGAPINDSGSYKIYSSEYGDTENMGDITVQQGYPDNDTPISGAAGGSIAWVTVDPSHKAGLDFSQTLGQNSYHRTFMRLNTGDLGPVRSWLSYSNNETNLWRGVGKSKVTKVDGKSVWTIDDKNSISFSLQYNREVKTNYESLTKAQAQTQYKQSYLGTYTPGSTSSNFYALHQNPFRNYLASADGEFTLSDNLRLSVVPYFQFGTGGSGSGSTFTENPLANNNYYKSVNVDLDGDGKISGTKLVNSFSYSNTYRPGIIAKLNQDLTDNNSLEYGVWYERPRQSQGQDFVPVDAKTGIPVDTWANTVLLRYPDGSVQKAYQQYTTTTNEKAFITDNWTPNDQWTFSGSLAYVWSKRDGYVAEFPNSIGSISTTGKVTTTNAQYDASPNATFHKFTPTAGVKYQLDAENQFYFGIGKTFRAPVNGAILSNALYGNGTAKASPLPNKPETSTTADLGWRFYGERFSANVDAYASNLNNKQISGYDQVTGLTVYTQLPSVHMRGLNAEGSYKITDNWSTYANYSYTRARMQDDLNSLGDGIYNTKGKTLLNVPKNSGYVGVDFNEGPFWASLNAKYQGPIWGDWSNTERAGGYTTVNLSTGWKFGDFADWFRSPYVKINLFNVGDRKALTYASNVTAFLATNPTKEKDANGTTLFASAPYYSVLQERTFMVTFGASFF